MSHINGYQGHEPFIFISYAHDDVKRFPAFDEILSYLEREGYRLWYDSCTLGGKRNDDIIAERITHCAVFIPLISKEFCNREYCRNELIRACEESCEVVPIYLENFRNPPGIDLRISGLRALNYYTYRTINEFFDDLSRSSKVADCLEVTALVRYKKSLTSKVNTIQSMEAHIEICLSPEDYHDRIIPLERSAHIIRRIPKRLSVIFKSQSAVRRIADMRHGRGNPNLDIYRDEHAQRKKIFYDGIKNGTLVVKEIYSKSELRRYFKTGMHGANVILEYNHLKSNLDNWQRCVEDYPDNYFVALTDLSIPNKYQVVDDHTISFHEAIGASPGGDTDRYNALFITNHAATSILCGDFDRIYNNTPPESRSIDGILSFITELREGLSQ